jgi:hypothetical protein
MVLVTCRYPLKHTPFEYPAINAIVKPKKRTNKYSLDEVS